MNDQAPLYIWWNKNLDGRISVGQLAAHAAHAALAAYGIHHEHPIIVLRSGKISIERMPVRLREQEGHGALKPGTVTVGVRDLSHMADKAEREARLVADTLTIVEDLLLPRDEAAAKAVRLLRAEVAARVNSLPAGDALDEVAAILPDVEAAAFAVEPSPEDALPDPLDELEARKLASQSLIVLRGRLNHAAPATKAVIERAIALRKRAHSGEEVSQ